MLAEIGKPIANTGFEPGSGPVFLGFPGGVPWLSCSTPVLRFRIDGLQSGRTSSAIRLLDQALDLVAMAFADRMHQRSPDQSSHRSALLYRLKNYILTHLRDPELSMPRAAAAIGISPRYASDLMAAEGRGRTWL